MMILLEIAMVAVFALLVARLAPQPWRGRVLNLLKAWVTVRAFWILFTHQVKLEDGSLASVWSLILGVRDQVVLSTFLLFSGLAAAIKFVGILASMFRWQLLLRGQQIDLPFRHIFGSFLIGRFIGTFLPSTAGLDGYKLFDAARFSGKTVEVTATTMLEKVIGFSGIFLSFLVALPFGIVIFGDNATWIAAITVPFCTGLIAALLVVLWYPGIVQWGIETLPIPGKARLGGIVRRVSHAAAAYRDKKGLVITAFALSFVVHFTTAAMYYFTALAIGAVNAEFWPIAFGSSIQILATVLSPFTIAGEGIREAAQYVLLGNLLGPANAIVSAALGFWAAEALTLAGAYFWWFRPTDYRPEYCRVAGVQVDYEEAARAAASLEEPASGEAAEPAPPFLARARLGVALGLGAGLIGGLLVGMGEGAVIAAGGLDAEAQVLWYGPLVYALLLGGLGALGGFALALLPMDHEEARGWTPALAWIGTALPIALFISVFRVRRDLYLEQMPPVPVLLGILGGFALLGLLIFTLGPRLFRGGLGRLVRPATAALAVLAIAIAGGVASALWTGESAGTSTPPPVPSEVSEAPNLILVMVDTLRADRLSCYGGPVPTPNLCSLGEGGTRLLGFSHSSWTKPAAATLLTSTLPSSHGVMSKPSALSQDAVLIPEVLSERGYATGGVVSNINLAPTFGFRQGYDEYHYLAPDYLFGARESSSQLILYQIARRIYFKFVPGLRVGDFYQSAETVNEVAFDFLDRHRDSRFFLFLHYMDPHDPYFEHPWNGVAIDRASNQHPDPSQADEMHRLYLGEIEYLDEHFGALLERLRELGVFEDTVIALVSDHGEEFYEHGGWWHGTTLYEEQIAVPFLVKWARSGGRAGPGAGALARMIDVGPTLVARSGAEPPESMQGIDLAKGLDARSERERMVFAEEDHEGNVLRALRTEHWKWIEANAGNPRGLPEEQLFRISEDPGERDDQLERNAWVVDELRNHADAQQRLAESESLGDDAAASLSAAEEEALRALGYLSDEE